jgi:hypothetical protein
MRPHLALQLYIGPIAGDAVLRQERRQSFGSVDLSGFTEAEAEGYTRSSLARLGGVAADASAGRSDT